MLRSVAVLLWIHVNGSRDAACDGRKKIAWYDAEREVHHNYIISVAEMHMKFLSCYSGNGRPPMKEAYLIHSAPLDLLESVFGACLGLIITAELLVFEAELLVAIADPLRAPRFDYIWKQFNSLNPEVRNEVMFLWPIAAAVARVNVALRTRASSGRTTNESTIDIVICHCTEPLESLLRHFTTLPPSSRLFVYEKCGSISDLSSFPGQSKLIPQRDGPVRGDECTAYLHHIIHNYESLSDFTVFLQDDADHHMFLSFMDTALKGIITGQYSVPFLHLNFHRHYQTTTPCMRDVERVLFNLSSPVEPLPLIGTYCCAQFIVEKQRILARPMDFYEKAFSLVNGTVDDMCSPTPPKRSSHCYVLEYLWHVVFGEDRFLPHKPDDERLPLLLRMKNGNENVKSRWDDVELVKNGDLLLNRTIAL
jgi:hypothetical protein